MRSPEEVLRIACGNAGVDVTKAELIRAGENHIYRLPGAVVARVTRLGQVEAARKEVNVSRWLAAAGIPAVQALVEVAQPIELDGRAVTLWRELPAHRKGTLGELAWLLRQLHALPAPDFDLPPLAPFVRLRERLHEATELSYDDQSWLLERLRTLEVCYAELATNKPLGAVHGDAWTGNVATTANGPILLDLERFAYGPPEWDLVSTAIGYTTFGTLARGEWQDFCDQYGYDVITWEGFAVLRDIRELRKVTFAWQLAADRQDIAQQAKYRLACLRGEHGPRPWEWTTVP